MNVLIQKLTAVEHGFKSFEAEAQKIVDNQSLSESKAIAVDMLRSEFYQVRCCAIFILGFITVKDNTVLHLLKNVTRSDESWQVQEIIAKAFDQYCKDNGYENSLPEIKAWLSDEHPNVCRAVTEGLRIWTGRPYFKTHPEVAIDLISRHKANDSEYLRKSVGNSLRDISKKYGELVRMEIAKWDLQDKRIAFTYDYVLKRH
ncbi:MAG: DNA alkylation repair enzyme [Chryseobacterium sp.]|uniref:DNA alkylation repair protein n=1 Tax=Chryseobacterium sp. TaxID=1871047 RepID=UPI000DB2D720|nr:DNA alkylation repair protein [Chryseobacterium sp.]MPS64800.1 HEAT repeat domain-containing protein [Chryseobacterium sp.]PZU19027.1 MAG: DNA alkylation repair enzyme [Chryseobacterium sp.]